MRVSGQTVVNFLATHFEFLEQLYQFAKNNSFYIPSEVLTARCNGNKTVIDIRKLVEYQMVRLLEDNNYVLHPRFREFIGFLIADFRLDLPESIQKYQEAIKNIFNEITLDYITLNPSKTINQIVSLNDGLITEIESFSIQIEENTDKLFADSLELKENKEQLDYADKVRKASLLIENYIKPLNDILNKEHSHSFVKLLASISEFANLQRHEQADLGIRAQFKSLYYRIAYVNDIILKKSALMSKELTPLLERLKTESEILQGAIYFLRNMQRGKKIQPVPFPDLKSKRSYVVYDSNFDTNVKRLFEFMKKQETVIMAPMETLEKPKKRIVSTDFFKAKLLQELPVHNFFQWCYDALINVYQIDINAEKFYSVSTLLFEKEVQATFLYQPKFEIELEDYILKVPYVTVQSIEK